MRILAVAYFTLLFSISLHAQSVCDSIPLQNQGILQYTNSVMGKRVGKGQCWDVANEALISISAKWEPPYVYGRLVDPEKECVFPGDIVQFEGVKIEYRTANSRTEESMGHHTAIIYEVTEPGKYILAHQNYGPNRRKVLTTKLSVANIVRGKYMIYRPQ